MRGVYPQQMKVFRGWRTLDLTLILLALVLAVLTAVGITVWSGNPRPLLAHDEILGVPRARTGLVLTNQNRGQVLFGRYCDSCHADGRQAVGPSMRTDSFKSEYATVDSVTQVVRNGGFDMPAFPQDLLSDEDLQQIAQYVLNLPSENP